MNIDLLFLIVIAILIGAVSGYLGSFMILKRMSLVGDALSHVALPGMAIALALGINPMLGAFVTLSLAVLGIWRLSETSEIYPEALVGIFFTASLAIGILITPEPELLEALFGSIEKINLIDGVIIAVGTTLAVVLTRMIANKLLLGIVSEDLAKSTKGLSVSKVNLIYLFLVGLIVALGVKFVGTLLTGALVIIPAAAAKNISQNINSFQAIAIGLGIISAVLGIAVSSLLSISSGPAVVLVSILFFILTFVFKK